MGLSRRSPDEFAVMQRAPLVVPEDLSVLPAPRPGAPRPMETPATQQAKIAVLGEAGTQNPNTPSPTENSLLTRAGAANADPDIRGVVNSEAKNTATDKRPVYDRLLGILDDETPATVVDPVGEARRIQDAKKAGRPITTGETPTVQE